MLSMKESQDCFINRLILFQIRVIKYRLKFG
jgi:hypothetical protein